MQKSPNIDKPLPMIELVLHQNFKAVQFPDKLKSLRKGALKIVNKPTEVKCELSAQDGKTFHTHRNHLTPY